MAEGTGRTTFKEVFGVAEFRAMWFGELLSVFGDQLARVALSVLVFRGTSSATLTGLTYALTYAPSLFGGIFLSGLADRFPRRTVMVAVDLTRTLLIAAVAIPGLPFWAMALLVAGVSLLNPPFKAAQLALLPQVLSGDRFVVGMGIRNMTIQSAQLIGFAGGGLLIATVDAHVALLLDAGTFVLSALCIRIGLKYRPAATGKEQRRSFFSSIGQGGKLLFGDPTLRVLVLLTWFLGMLPVYEGIAAPYAAMFGGGSQAVGLLLASDPLGSVIGVFLFTRWVPEAMRPKVAGVLALLAAVPMLACFANPGLVLSMILFVVSGALGTVALMQVTASLTLGVPDEQRAQAMGLSNTGMTTAIGVSPLIGGLLTDHIGAGGTVGIFGVAGLVVMVPLAITWRRSLRARQVLAISGATSTGTA